MSWTGPVTHATGDLITAAAWNNEITGNMTWLYTGSGWQNLTNLTYHNSWADSSGPGGKASYRLIGTVVQFSGIVTGGASGNSLTSSALPSAYRPPQNVAPTANNSSSVVVVTLNVSSAGVITPNFSTGSTVSLDGVSYPTV